jgi:hypothetical protein
MCGFCGVDVCMWVFVICGFVYVWVFYCVFGLVIYALVFTVFFVLYGLCIHFRICFLLHCHQVITQFQLAVIIIIIIIIIFSFYNYNSHIKLGLCVKIIILESVSVGVCVTCYKKTVNDTLKMAQIAPKRNGVAVKCILPSVYISCW